MNPNVEHDDDDDTDHVPTSTKPSSLNSEGSSSIIEYSNQNDTDEQALLASMDVYLLEQNIYERDVLRQASYQTVPLLFSDTITTTPNHHHQQQQQQQQQQPPQQQQQLLLLFGFPSSMAHELLQPFHHHHHHHDLPPTPSVKSTYKPKRNDKSNNNINTKVTSDVLQSILDNVRQERHNQQPQQRQLSRSKEKFDTQNLCNMKEQILLHLFTTIGMTPKSSCTSSISINQPHKNDPLGKDRTTTFRKSPSLQSSSLQSSSKTEMEQRMKQYNNTTSTTVTTTLQNMEIKGGKINRRIPMMKRKRIMIEPNTYDHNNNNKDGTIVDDDNTNNDTLQQQQQQILIDELKVIRRQRIQKRHHKYSNNQKNVDALEDESVSSQEQEMDDLNQIIDNEHEHGNNDISHTYPAQLTTTTTTTTDSTSSAMMNDTTSTTTNRSITCPLCQQNIHVEEEQDSDAILAVHMNQCQQQNHSRTTRSKRQRLANVTTTYNDNTETKENDRDPVVQKRMYQKLHIAKVAPKASQPLDDMDENDYDDRVDEWIVNGLRRMKHMKERDPNEMVPNEVEYDNQFYIPAWMNNHLFQYQRNGIEWMYQLHQQMTGGIIGDEMGLGKTVQVAAFLGAAAASRFLKSVLIVAPATILQHWLTELTIWAPGLRRILIHTSGGSLDRFDRSISYPLLQSLSKWLRKCRSLRVNEPIDDEDWDTMEPHTFCGTGYVIVTTYENLRRNAELYASHDWSYVVLDEAQKIRNPDADITLACKRIRTPHRLAMSGTPIQNDLRELWSLLDFVFPGRLGTLPTFEQEFATPIKYGGYSNASPMQVQLAYRCAIMLRDMIEPFLLRRLKKDVKEVSRMPGKTEHVLFCRLSPRQRAMYEAYLKSDAVARVFRGNHMLLAAITVLRKIANHPDLVCDPSDVALDNFIQNRGNIIESKNDDASDSDEYNADDGYVGDEQSLLERSGKLDVLAKILPIWKKQGHRVLIFCQWRKMLDIIERFVHLQGWKFGRLDGNTNIASRQRLVDSFNTDESYFGMLCTTRTGGVGLNLIGANRCILYDPDWNPSGDAQARERAWRFGQVKEVTIYRLITAGTIEEKIYQRQIFKTAMTNKVLQDAKQRRLFSQRDLKDLFSLSADSGSIRSGGDGITSTSAITNGVGVVESVDLEGKDSGDNEVALKKLMKSKGLAGIFDHHSVEPDHKRKSTTVREMEEKAKQVAKEAAQALQKSVAEHDPFTPTWTGSNETKPVGIFGTNRVGQLQGSTSLPGTVESLSSSNLLASIRQRNAEIESGESTSNHGHSAYPETQKYTKLLSSLKDYVKRHRPSTEDILKEFDDVPDTDVAIFRRLLKSIATMQKGRWYLIDNY